MPLDNLPFDSREELLNHLTTDMELADTDAEEVVQVLMEEAESEEGNAKQLLQSIKNGAKSILSDIGLETVSWVENPSQDSMFVMMKNDGNRVKKTTSIYKQPEENWETVYGPVMRPNDIDKDGDVASASDIQKAAHQFIAEGRVNQFDTDHDLNTGKGTLVESWILKEDKEYELPNGETEKIEEGSWMVGVQPNEEVRKRIENGEITGWSIFGQADQISLKNEANFKTENQSNSFKDDTMTENQSNNEKQEDGSEEVSMKDMHSSIQELKSEFKEYVESPEPTTVKSVEELQNTLENLEKEDEKAVIELSSDVELTQKEPEMENMGELLDFLENELNETNFGMLVDAVRGEGEDESEEVEEEMDEDEEDEDMEKEETEKQANHKAANGSSAGTQSETDEGIEKDVSFQKIANEYTER